MGKNLLGEDAPDAKDEKRSRRCEPWQVEKLVTMGVPRRTALSFTLAQAYTVMNTKAKSAAVPFDRVSALESLTATVEADAVKADDAEMVRTLFLVLLCLTPAERGRVAKGLLNLLKS